jgi:hypothetical protein
MLFKDLLGRLRHGRVVPLPLSILLLEFLLGIDHEEDHAHGEENHGELVEHKAGDDKTNKHEREQLHHVFILTSPEPVVNLLLRSLLAPAPPGLGGTASSRCPPRWCSIALHPEACGPPSPLECPPGQHRSAAASRRPRSSEPSWTRRLASAYASSLRAPLLQCLYYNKDGEKSQSLLHLASAEGIADGARAILAPGVVEIFT